MSSSSTNDTSNSNNNNNDDNRNRYRGSGYASSSFSEIEEINEDGNKEDWKINASSKRLNHITEEQISRLCPSEGSREEEDIVYVVVGKGETTTNALQWTLHNAVNPVTSTLYLIHVFPDLKWVPNPLGNGKIHRSQVRKEKLEMYLEEERVRRRQLLNKFMETCNSHRVKVETILIESETEATAILELISVLNIQKLVIGVSKSDLRKLRSRKGSGVADMILQKAPNWCEVKCICEGKDALEDIPLDQTSPQENPGDTSDNDETMSTPSPTENQLPQTPRRDVPGFAYCCFKPATQ